MPLLLSSYWEKIHCYTHKLQSLSREIKICLRGECTRLQKMGAFPYDKIFLFAGSSLKIRGEIWKRITFLFFIIPIFEDSFTGINEKLGLKSEMNSSRGRVTWVSFEQELFAHQRVLRCHWIWLGADRSSELVEEHLDVKSGRISPELSYIWRYTPLLDFHWKTGGEPWWAQQLHHQKPENNVTHKCRKKQ